ncbi:hypothetical protein O181_042531 [Austropuccinia psidii MF-1]|uniref:Uncharacterized protein n=1 Tax=Austropuccinia psidii MF-1 TaxID=1389203 RepID=A0A9Q3DF15_9BASI|nr:hypothetical protein [Austropuccinia psidii MF-1]
MNIAKINTSYTKNYIYLSFLFFEDNPTNNNQTTVERLVEEPCESFPTPVVNKRRKAKKLVFPAPTIQYSEEEYPNTSSNHMDLDPEVELIPQKGRERERIPFGTEFTQESAISQRQVPEVTIISVPEL